MAKSTVKSANKASARATSSKRSKKASNKAPTKPVVSHHGGRSLEGRRKVKRPLEAGQPTHVVLSSKEAKGRLSFSTPANRKMIDEVLKERGSQFGIRVQHVQATPGRLHLIVTFKDSAKFQGFLRTITSLLARKITGAKKGNPFGRKFWDHIAFTRTIERSSGTETDSFSTDVVEAFEKQAKTKK